MIAVLGFEFGNQINTPNRRLAKKIAEIYREHDGGIVVVVQSPLDILLIGTGVEIDFVVKSDKYIDSDTVLKKAEPIFSEKDVWQVIPVANPFLHMRLVEGLLAKTGYEVVKRDMGKIEFDPDSKAWWCRGRMRLLIYAVLRKLFRYHGNLAQAVTN